MSNQVELNLGKGLDERDRGVDQVEKNNKAWRLAARQLVILVADRGIPFTSDEVRAEAYKDGLPKPHHPNAWGAVFVYCAKKGHIEKTGEYRQSQLVTNHARMVPVWRGVREGW